MKQIKNFCTLYDLRKLEVINICTGKRLGCIVDVELDLCLGTVLSIIVPKRIEINEIFNKKENKYYKIPWCCIERIGNDIILVRIDSCN